MCFHTFGSLQLVDKVIFYFGFDGMHDERIREAPSGRGLPRKRVGEPYGINDLGDENNCAFKNLKITSSKITSSRMLLPSRPCGRATSLPEGGLGLLQS